MASHVPPLWSDAMMTDEDNEVSLHMRAMTEPTE